MAYCSTMNDTALLSSPLAVLVTLTAIASLFFHLEHRTRWKLFHFLPPLIFIYAIPVILSNTGVLATQSPIFDGMDQVVLPFLLTIMLLKVDVVSAVRIMGKGVLVMLCGTLGVILGAPLAYLLVRHHLDPTAWRAFGTLAGSWIGGTANMMAASQGVEASPTELGLAVLGDNMVYIVWLPILLGSKALADRFNRWARVNPEHLQRLEESAIDSQTEGTAPAMRHLLYLLLLGCLVTWIATELSSSENIKIIEPVLTASTWKILIVTTLGLLLSMTPARRIPGSHELAMALIYLFVASMGARADLSGLQHQAIWFLLGAYLWIFIHGLFCLLGARLLHVDLHSVAIASAANVGGAASAPVVAGHHNPRLVPVSILMALLGYAVGTYGAFIAAWLCELVAPF